MLAEGAHPFLGGMFAAEGEYGSEEDILDALLVVASVEVTEG